MIIGERTWGKGSVQNVIELENGKSALKLTTASYQRPSGKNIHRFPDSKESDEWGVMPDKGFELKLADNEMGELMRYRRDRDILRAHQKTDTVAAASTEEKPAAPAGDEAKPGSAPSAKEGAPAKEPAAEKPKNPEDKPMTTDWAKESKPDSGAEKTRTEKSSPDKVGRKEAGRDQACRGQAGRIRQPTNRPISRRSSIGSCKKHWTT